MAGASVTEAVDTCSSLECPTCERQDCLQGERTEKRGAPQEPDEPDSTAAKRVRAASSVVDLDAVAARFKDATEKARSLLAPQEEEAEAVDEAAMNALAGEVENARQKQRAAEALWQEEQAALALAKADLKAVELARESAASAQSEFGPAFEEFERVAAELASACREAAQQVASVMAADSAQEVAELDLEEAEPSLVAARQRLAAVQRQKQELAGECREAEAARVDAEARLAACEHQFEEQRRRAEAEEAARQAEAQASTLQGEIDKLEAEAAAAAQALAEQQAAAAAAAAEEAQQLAKFEKRIEELQKLCEEEACKGRELEAKCAAANARTAPVEGQEAEPVGTERSGKPKPDVVDPTPLLNVRAAQRLYISTEDVPEVAGEYRLVQGGARGWPAYKAARPEAVFLLWSPREGGRWVFARDALGADLIFARSLQLAWTTLPDELMASSWTRAAWGVQGPCARISILRG